MLEKLDELTILTGIANTDPKKRPKKTPKAFRYPRPFKPARPTPATLSEIRAFFAR